MTLSVAGSSIAARGIGVHISGRLRVHAHKWATLRQRRASVRLVLRTLASTAATLIIAVAPAAADPIPITVGALVYPASPLDISVNLAGDGFAFSGSALRTGM